MCRVPNEVLLRVIDQLWRPPPPAEQTDIAWKDFHQQDLAQMMRVSRVAYELAGKRLYSVVAAKSLPDLLGEIGEKDDDPEGSVAGEKDTGTDTTRHCDTTGAESPDVPVSDEPTTRTTKRALLRQVRVIHVIQTEPFYQGYVDDALSPPAYDPSAAQPDPKLMEWFASWQTGKSGLSESYESLLPNLTSLSGRAVAGADARYVTNWIDKYKCFIRGLPFRRAARAFMHDRVGHASYLRPRHSCRTASIGPFALWRPSWDGPSGTERVSPALVEAEDRGKAQEAEFSASNTLHLRSVDLFDTIDDWGTAIHAGSHNFIDLGRDYDLARWILILDDLCLDILDSDSKSFPATRVTFMLQRPRFDTGEEEYLQERRSSFKSELARNRKEIVAKLEADLVYADTCDPCGACGLSYAHQERDDEASQEQKPNETDRDGLRPRRPASAYVTYRPGMFSDPTGLAQDW